MRFADEHFETILRVLADIQVSVDEVDRRTERLVEIVAWTDTDSPQPPDWVNRDPSDE